MTSRNISGKNLLVLGIIFGAVGYIIIPGVIGALIQLLGILLMLFSIPAFIKDRKANKDEDE